MLDLIWTIILTSLKAIALIVFCYLFYWRVIDYLYAVWFYGRQGRDTAVISPGFLPFLGNLIPVLKSFEKSRRDGDNYHVM